MNSAASGLTLQQLINLHMKEKGLSRSQLMRAMGRKNISKGLRRLDHYLQTLECPSDEFVVKLLSVLDIDGLTFCRAVAATLHSISEKNRQVFKPWIQIKLGIDIRGAFAFQAIQNRCTARVAKDIQKLPFAREVDAVIAVFQDLKDSSFAESPLLQHITGFMYYRTHTCYLEFDTALTLVNIQFITPTFSGRPPLGNRIADMLMGGGL